MAEHDSDGTEFWCGTCMRPLEEVDGIPGDGMPVDEYFAAETPSQGGPDRNEGFAPVHWVRTVIRKVRTFGVRR